VLVENLPALVFIENNEHIDAGFRKNTAELRRALCCMLDFRLGAARNLGVVVDAFANPLDPKGIQESMHEPLVSALRLIFNDEEGNDWAQITAFLSPWKLAASAAVTSFVLQQIGQRIDRDSTKTQAKAELSKLVDRLMHNAITAVEADFVSEMAKGVVLRLQGR
jgi:mediator of RNA polymerase II transcription subunit 12